MPLLRALPVTLRDCIRWLCVAVAGLFGIVLSLRKFFPVVFYAPSAHFITALTAFGSAVAALVLGLIMTRRRWSEFLPLPPEDTTMPLPRIRQTRGRRIALARHFLPAPRPADWTTPVCVKGRVTWRFSAADVLVETWVLLEHYGPKLFVAMMNPEGSASVPDTTAAEILRHFRDVLDFIEIEDVPTLISASHPEARCWIALPVEALDALRDAPRPVVPPAEQLSEQRRIVRSLLPDKAPLGWSAPIAVPELPEGWMIRTDGVLILLALVTTEEGVRLMVTLIPDDADSATISESWAADILRNLRGVRDLAQIDGSDIRGGRVFLGVLEGTEHEGAENVQRAPKVWH